MELCSYVVKFTYKPFSERLEIEYRICQAVSDVHKWLGCLSLIFVVSDNKKTSQILETG